MLRPLAAIAFGLAAVLMVLFAAAAPIRAAEAEPEAAVSSLVVTNSSRDLLLYAHLDHGLDAKAVEGVKNGIPATIIFEIELDLVRHQWPDKEIGSFEIEHTLSYDNLKDTYNVLLTENGAAAMSGRSLDEARALMAEVNGFILAPLSALEPDHTYVLKVRARLRQKTLPFYFDYLIPFGGIGGYETEWATTTFHY